MAAVRDALPKDTQDDKRLHCLAAGGIALRCSVAEADIAGVGKEFQDLFTGGDASWADWRADRAGIRCAKSMRAGSKAIADSAPSADGLATCCAAAGY